MASKIVSTAWTTSIRAMRTTSMTQTTSTSTSTRTPTRASCTCEHGSQSAQSPSFLMSCRTRLIGSRCSWVFTSSRLHACGVLSDLTFLPFYFDLSFPVFFHSSVLMHPEQHTDLDNLSTVQHNLRTSAKGSNDAYDVTVSLTSYEPNDMVFNELGNSQGSFSYVTPSSDLDIDDRHYARQAAHRSTPRICRLPQSGRRVRQSVVIVCRVR